MDSRSVVLADDHRIFREGLMRLINMEEDLQVVAEAENGAEAIKAVESLSPDVAVFDITMPEVSGLDALRHLSKNKLSTHFILLTMLDEQEIFDEALSLGVSGYVLKEDSSEDLLKAIRTVLDGKIFISPSMSDKLFSNRKTKKSVQENAPGLALLSCREMDVLRCLSSNMTSKEIGKELFISHRTVQLHRAHITEKLGIEGRNQLLAFAITNARFLPDSSN